MFLQFIDLKMQPNKKFLCFGIWSRCIGEEKFAIFADFDAVDKDKIVKKTHDIIKKYKTNDFFLIENTKKEGHFHLYCPTKVDYQEYLKILNEFIKIGMDKNFMVPLVKWLIPTTVLRFYSKGKGKLRYASWIPCEPSQRNARQMSLAHLLFLNKIYGVDISDYTNHDGKTRATCDIYFTQKK